MYRSIPTLVAMGKNKGANIVEEEAPPSINIPTINSIILNIIKIKYFELLIPNRLSAKACGTCCLVKPS